MLESLADAGAYLPSILILLMMSAFFSGSEAACFSLTLTQYRSLAKSTRNARIAHVLISRSERLLMGILFWNLAINLSYFSLVSRAAMAAQPSEGSAQLAALIAIVALITLIVFGEFLPKSLAVLYPIFVVKLVAVPLSISIRILDTFLPVIKFVNEASRRLLWPGLKPESYLETADLERAIELSTDDAQLVEQERQVLRNVVRLNEITVEEWMRPRTQFRTFVPPLTIEQLGGERTPSGYMLVTNNAGTEVSYAIRLNSLLPGEADDLAASKLPLVVVPWCAKIADALKKLRDAKRRVAVVVNEFGETIGILTWEDILDAVLHSQDPNSNRELAKAEVYLDDTGSWLATGMTKLRRLERLLGRRLEVSRNLTVGGVVQEQLHRLPEKGDACQLENLQLEVVEAAGKGEILVRITELSEAPQVEEDAS